MNPLTQSKNTTILPVLIALTLGCVALSPQARAICQEGCFPNDNTVLGDNALLNHTGLNNTAIGSDALRNNINGNWNTAAGGYSLHSNTTVVRTRPSVSMRSMPTPSAATTLLLA
jgi:hypothetical protein